MLARYVVVNMNGTWFIEHGSTYYEYTSEAEAIQNAIDAAQKAGKGGNQAQVFTKNALGSLNKLWTYGTDPYPPR